MRTVLLSILIALAGVALSAQSLADISRREQKKRQPSSAAKSTTVYLNQAPNRAATATPGQTSKKTAAKKRSFTNEDLAKAGGSLSFSKIPDSLKNRPHAPAPSRRSGSAGPSASADPAPASLSPPPAADLGSRSPLTRPYG